MDASWLHAVTPGTFNAFMRHIHIDDEGCWNWSGASMHRGRPRITILGVTMAPYQFSWLAHTGQVVPDPLVLLHSCDNPHCCNPKHLRPDTVAANNAEMMERGRARNQNSQRTVCHRGHPLDEANTYVRPDGRRECRICKTNYSRRTAASAAAGARSKDATKGSAP